MKPQVQQQIPSSSATKATAPQGQLLATGGKDHQRNSLRSSVKIPRFITWPKRLDHAIIYGMLEIGTHIFKKSEKIDITSWPSHYLCKRWNPTNGGLSVDKPPWCSPISTPFPPPKLHGPCRSCLCLFDQKRSSLNDHPSTLHAEAAQQLPVDHARMWDGGILNDRKKTKKKTAGMFFAWLNCCSINSTIGDLLRIAKKNQKKIRRLQQQWTIDWNEKEGRKHYRKKQSFSVSMARIAFRLIDVFNEHVHLAVSEKTRCF